MSNIFKKHIESSTPYLASRLIIGQTLRDEDNKDEASFLAIKREMIRIKRSSAALEYALSEWRKEIATLEGENLAAELKIFDETIIEGKHFMDYLELSRQIIVDLEIELAEDSLEGSSQSNPTSDADRHEIPPVNHFTAPEVKHGAEPTSKTRPTFIPFSPTRRQNHGNGEDFGDDYLPIRMPPFKIPTFNGDRLAWPAFWQAFETSIDTLRIPPVQKLTYLISHLDRKVSSIIAGYSITNENYELVKKVLIDEYGNAKAIQEALQAELIHLAAPSESVSSLQFFLHSIDRICRQLENMKLLNKKDGFLLNIIKSKLPKRILENVLRAEKAAKDKWSLDLLRSCLADYVDLQTEVDRCISLRGDPRPPVKKEFKSYKEPAPEVRTFAVVNPPNKGTKYKNLPPCCFCDGSHWASECPKFKTKESRTKALAEQKRCFRCLRKDHNFKECTSTKNCTICNGSHHRCICPKTFPQTQASRPSFIKSSNSPKFQTSKALVHTTIAEEMEENYEDEAEKVVVQSTVESLPSGNLLMSAEVELLQKSTGESIKALVLFDTASQITFVRKELVETLNPPKVGENTLDIFSALLSTPTRIRTPKYKLAIKLANGQTENIIAYKQNWLNTKIECANLSSGKIVLSNRQPDILVGIAEFWRFFRGIEEISPHFYHIHTSVGAVYCGRRPGISSLIEKGPIAALTLTVPPENSQLDMDKVNKFWDLESIGIMDHPSEKDEDIAFAQFNSTIKQVNGRYRVKWPFKSPNPDLPSNYNLSFSRLKSVLEKLKQTPEILQKYHQTILDQLSDNIIEEAQRNPANLEHYIPHHGVITLKLRIVYDASAHIRGHKSLNECLYAGPNFLPDLTGLILRFRLPPIAIWADIQAAFLQIELDFEDREVTKFLWIRDPSKPISPSNLVIYRFQRVPFGVISSPFLLAATVRHHLGKIGSPLAKQIRENIYVDNTFMACENEKQAENIYKEAKEIFNERKMNLREFISNSKAFNSFLPKEDLLAKEPKALGIPWNINSDELILKFPKISVGTTVTRRLVLHELASNFDPLGLKVPCLLKGKLLFQATWDEIATWDDPLPKLLQKEWRVFTQEWATEPFLLKRRIISDGFTPVELHAMVDASKDAYCVAIYLVNECDGIRESNLIFSKSRLRPHKKEISIPRMELLGMTLGVRALKFVQNEFKLTISLIFLWTDSQPILSWINSSEKQPKFIANRLQEIRKNEELCFRHVPTADNPADYGTRGISVADWKSNNCWWKGPDWLVSPPVGWPAGMIVQVKPKEGEVEISSLPAILQPVMEIPIDFNRFSDFHILISAVIFFLRFLSKFQRNFAAVPESIEFNSKADLPEAAQWKLAENLVVRLVQRNMEETMDKLKGCKTFKDKNGIIRVQTRIRKQGNFDLAHPILLPKDSTFTRLLIMYIHRKQLHLGANSTLNAFLQRFWIPQARKTIKGVIRKCLLCSRINSPPFSLPKFPPLPSDRVEALKPFSSVGIDYFGPTFCRLNHEKEKCWLIIITCLTTRAVYLAPVLDISSFTLMHILRRFFSRRGVPCRILSDNGSQFRVLSKIWPSKNMDHSQLKFKTFLAENHVEWRHIPEFSPWFGSVYERLIGIVKSAFKRTVGKKILDWQEFESFSTEVESVVNQRPLTWVGDGPNDFKALRPVDFLIPHANLIIPISSLDNNDSDDDFLLSPPKKAEEIRGYWQKMLKSLDTFWEIWKVDYLLMLRERTLEQSGHKGPRSQTIRPPKIGEVVLMTDEGKSRNLWPIGRIIELNADQFVRTAKLRLASGKTFTRPINKLFPLEVGEEESNVVQNPANDEPAKSTNKPGESGQTVQPIFPLTRMTLRPRKNLLPPVSIISLLCILFYSYSFGGVNGRPTMLQSCRECSLECTSEGVLAKMSKQFDKIFICCNQNEICLSHNFIPELGFSLPNKLLVVDYECKADFLNKRGLKFQRRQICPGKDPCNLMESFFEFSVNPECFPKWSITVYSGLLIFALIFLCCVLSFLRKFLKNFIWIFKIICFPITFFINILSRCLPVNCLKGWKRGHKRPSNRRKLNRLRRLGVLAIVLMSFSLANAASETVSLTALTEDCEQTINGTTCKIEAKTLITLLPSGQVVNILLKGKDTNLFGEIELVMDSLAFNCIPQTVKFLRSYKITTTTHKSCPLDRSCQIDYCDKVRPDTPVSELQDVHFWPGFTFCINSCAFLWCGCGVVPGFSCLFYRFYAQPISDDIFQLIRCQNWQLNVLTKITIFKDGIKDAEGNVELLAGMTSKWNGLSLSLIGVSQPPAPIFNRFFLLNSKSNMTALVDDINSDLFCQNEEKAQNFTECSLLRTACSDCFPAHDREMVDCTCRDLDLEQYFTDPEKRLPLATSHQNFRMDENNHILAETSHTPIQIMLKYEGQSITVRQTKSKCHLEPISLHGCYNCISGAEFSYKCKSDFGSPIAEAKCDNVQFGVHCDTKATLHNITLSFSNAEISTSCELNCGEGLTEFRLEGHLYFLSFKEVDWNSNSIKSNLNSSTYWTMPFLNNFNISFDLLEITDFFKSNLIYFIIIIVLIFTILITVAKFSPIFRLWRLVSRIVFFAAGACLMADGKVTDLDKIVIQPILAHDLAVAVQMPRLLHHSKTWMLKDDIYENEDGQKWKGKSDSFQPTKRWFIPPAICCPFSQLHHSASAKRQAFQTNFSSNFYSNISNITFFNYSNFMRSSGQSMYYNLHFPLCKYTRLLLPFPLNHPANYYPSRRSHTYFLIFYHLYQSNTYFLLPKNSQDQYHTKMPVVRVNALQVLTHHAKLPEEDAVERLLSSYELRTSFTEILRSYPTWTNHLGDFNRIVNGTRLTVLGANLLSAFRDSARRTTVAQYYRLKLFDLKYPSGPCFSEPGGRNHVSYFPIELIDLEFPNTNAFLKEMRFEVRSLGFAGRLTETENGPTATPKFRMDKPTSIPGGSVMMGYPIKKDVTKVDKKSKEAEKEKEPPKRENANPNPDVNRRQSAMGPTANIFQRAKNAIGRQKAPSQPGTLNQRFSPNNVQFNSTIGYC